MRKLFRAMIALVVVLTGLFFWFTRAPTTELIDASGRELTAGSAIRGEDEVFGGSLFEEAQFLIKSKDFATAKEALLRIIEQSDRDGEACIFLCDVSRELKEVDEAVDYGLKAVELLPDSPGAHLAYAEALGLQMLSNMRGIGGMLSAMTRLGTFRKALARVIELDPDDTEARTMLVFLHMAPKPIGDIDRAIELCGEIESRDPVLGKQLLAVCYQRKEETELAIEICLEGIEEYPEEGGFHYTLADIYVKEERFDAADVEYEAARKGGKGDVYYRSLYAQARMRIEHEFDPARAVALLDEFIADEPDGDTLQSVAHACWRKGNALEQLERREDALASYKEALRRDPDLELAKKAIAGLGQ